MPYEKSSLILLLDSGCNINDYGYAYGILSKHQALIILSDRAHSPNMDTGTLDVANTTGK